MSFKSQSSVSSQLSVKPALANSGKFFRNQGRVCSVGPSCCGLWRAGQPAGPPKPTAARPLVFPLAFLPCLPSVAAVFSPCLPLVPPVALLWAASVVPVLLLNALILNIGRSCGNALSTPAVFFLIYTFRPDRAQPKHTDRAVFLSADPRRRRAIAPRPHSAPISGVLAVSWLCPRQTPIERTQTHDWM
ncbi:hypothetical protein ES703_74016 [subsurface metagenome]